MDVGTGSITSIASLNSQTGSVYKVLVSPDNEELLLHSRLYQDGTFLSASVSRLDLLAGTWQEVPLNHSVEGEAIDFCQTEYSGCDLGYAQDGTSVRIEETFDLPSGRAAVLGQIPETGSATLRLFSIGEGDYGAPSLVTSPDGSMEVLRLRDLESGFFQLHLGPTGAPVEQMEQQTFITANHSTMAFDEASLYLYYFTRDPISGYTQLFRVENAE